MKSDFKFIVVGDIHASYVGPKRREDNYYACLIDKLKQIREIQKENNNCPVICLGDFFDHKVTEHLEKMIFDLVPLLKNWYSVIGNHDNHKENGTDLKGTSFGLLNETGILKLGTDFCKKFSNDKVHFDCFDYYNRDQYGTKELDKSVVNIAFVHDYIMPSGTKVNYEYKECAENGYNYVFAGHYHTPYSVTKGHTDFINPGSLMRMTIAQEDMIKEPKIVLVDFSQKEPIIYHKLKIKSSEAVFKQNQAVLDTTFESKFTEMLLKNELVSGSSQDIVSILKKNKVDEKIVNYIEKKSKEVE